MYEKEKPKKFNNNTATIFVSGFWTEEINKILTFKIQKNV